MPVEIEAKFRLSSPHALHRRLTQASARRVAVIREVNTYFDTPDRDLKRADRGLRVRVEEVESQGTRVVITHKGPRVHGRLKSRQEDECVVASAEEALAMLQALGYRPIMTFDKRRTRFALGGCRVELDELPLLGWFVEIEGPSDKAVLAVRDTLKLESSEILRASYIAMLQAYAAEHGLADSILRLPEPEITLDALPAAG
ncbi:MAG: class IV adenylate cyclase [Planctomycetota bacterium]